VKNQDSRTLMPVVCQGRLITAQPAAADALAFSDSA
jgi:hypothetical protein